MGREEGREKRMRREDKGYLAVVLISPALFTLCIMLSWAAGCFLRRGEFSPISVPSLLLTPMLISFSLLSCATRAYKDEEEDGVANRESHEEKGRRKSKTKSEGKDNNLFVEAI